MEIRKIGQIEYSIVNISELGNTKRMDAKYFQPEFIENEEKIVNHNWCYIGDMIFPSEYGLSISMNEDERGYKILKMDNLSNGLAHDVNVKYADISEKLFLKYKLNKYDILFNRVNSEEFVGRTGIYMLDGEHIFASYLIRLRTLDEKMSSYLTMFLNSKHGKKCLNRISRRAVKQANINAEELKKVKVPIPSKKLSDLIDNIVVKSNKLRRDAERYYKESESILLKDIGFDVWSCEKKIIKIGSKEYEIEKNFSIRNASLTKKFCRLDSEYWEDKYSKIEQIIKNYDNGWDSLGNLFKHSLDKANVNKGENYKYVEISSININTGEIEPLILDYSELPANAKLKLHKNDIIISKVRTYRGGVSIITEDDFIGSSAFTVVRERLNLNKETLFVLMKSAPYKELTLKYNTGTSYPTLNDRDILMLPIPIIRDKVQKIVKGNINILLDNLKESKNMLDAAIDSIDIFIEQGEEQALKYLNDTIKN